MMKKFLLRFLLFLSVFAAGVIWLFSMKNDKAFAYHYIEGDCYNHGAWVYDRIFKNPEPIDIAFIGSSGTIHSVNENVIVKNLEGAAMNLKVCNLGYCRLGANLYYVLTKDLLKHKKVKYLFLEVRANEDYSSHPMFPYLADTRDLLFPKLWFNKYLFTDYYNALTERINMTEQKLFFAKQEYPYNPESFGYGASQMIADTVKLDKVKQKRKETGIEHFSAAKRNFNLNYPLAYLDKVVALAKANRIKIIFYYVEGYGTAYEEPQLQDYYRANGELWIAPDEIFSRKSNWMDENHLNDQGAEEYSKWLAKKISQMESAGH
jgi:hypothetical protein